MIRRRWQASSSSVLAAPRLRALQLNPSSTATRIRQLRRRSRKNSWAQPGDTVKAAGLMTRALLTQLALMGAADSGEYPRARSGFA
jgi:hypothetical protein